MSFLTGLLKGVLVDLVKSLVLSFVDWAKKQNKIMMYGRSEEAKAKRVEELRKKILELRSENKEVPFELKKELEQALRRQHDGIGN